jgi:hypothetical protein
MQTHSAECWHFRAERPELAESTRSIDGHDEMLAIADQFEELAYRRRIFPM